MEFKYFISSLLLTILPNSIIQSKCEKLGQLNSKQKEILKDYRSVATLEYGDQCNFELEAQGNSLREKVKPFLEKVLITAFNQGLQGLGDYHGNGTINMDPSLENFKEQLFNGLAEFTEKIRNFRICNDTKALFCDEFVGECRCGYAIEKKGFSLTHFDGYCKFEARSGCIQSELLRDSSLDCIQGTKCVTALDQLDCTLSNSLVEAVNYPTQFNKLASSKGYTCFCDNS